MRSDERPDERMVRALGALEPARERFHAAVAGAVDEVRGLLSRHELGNSRQRQTLELGEFAAARIDTDRFATLFAPGTAIDAAAFGAIRLAMAVLVEIAAWTDEDFVVRLGQGEDLRDRAAAALGKAGRAFGAARTVELARSHRFRADEHARLTVSFPPHEWNRAERQIAPPLSIELPGTRVDGCGLARFLDGGQQVVLVIGEPSPPAPLVRLITPNTLVAQVGPDEDLAPLLSGEGPAVVAIVPDGAARFVHDPRRDGTLATRLSIEHLPLEEPRGQLGGLGARQRREELLQLKALRDLAVLAEAAPAAVTATPVAGASPADHLAAWLLRQTDLTGIAEP